ncbi:MAG: Unknown protein [uncultured Thiotrichaceae bacterium]|uniref:DUF1841 domain-containing protein n=1 Tax=uncultured Thiotrichaceae bacterium TaxID=298394 RepID=A0A6S6TVQ6_9GAMM|nr:MAG: Unknown protein [uncultured Thiotrichaceae bacterium]
MFNNDRDSMRQFFCDSWSKAQNNQPLEPIEQLIVSVAQAHPEYHDDLSNPDKSKGKEYLPELNEVNPFLHMGMHLGIKEQCSVNMPNGITELVSTLAMRVGEHDAEHQVMECLAEAIWQMQHKEIQFNETAYLECVKKTLSK